MAGTEVTLPRGSRAGTGWRRTSRAVATAALTALATLGGGPAAQAAQLEAGAASVDATWRIGASAGQYASGCPDGLEDGSPDCLRRTLLLGDHGVDPGAHVTRRSPSYGVQSRLTVRALVVQLPGGRRMALVKNDLYIPQDMLWRRTAQLLEAGSSGVTRETLTMAVSHNHSSPYYSSSAWGAWAFQDVLDIRFLDYYSRRMALAVERAAARMVPARVSADSGRFDKTPRNSFGPATGDDGTPAGYPTSDTDHDMVVVRFDDVSDPDRPRPLANIINFSLHPEFLEGNDLISADYLGPLERMVDRRTGAMTLYTQNAVGTAEPERSTYHSIHERLEFTHRDYAQAEYGARLMADAALDIWQRAGTAEARVPARGDFEAGEVGFLDRWYPGPFSHPYPGVSNCRTDAVLGGRPGVPIIGLPDCTRVPGPSTGLSTDELQALGIPVPENYSAPSYTGLEEDVSVHLQAFRIGEILFTVCSCEQWKDQSENIATRTDKVAGNEYLGWDWTTEPSAATVSQQTTDRCERLDPDGYTETGGSGRWRCPHPNGDRVISDRLLKRIRAQVRNPANGWNDAENVLEAESEPTDPRRIRGNFTHDDDERSAALGYDLTVPISMANDYNGYIASYREYQRGDHYRKALTGWGAHSSDYMATRLVTLGRLLRDPAHRLPRDQQQESLLAPKTQADLALDDVKALSLGSAGAARTAIEQAVYPDDGGPPGPVEQPRDIERFGTAVFRWTGGSNYTDDPVVRVQRRVGENWVDYADQSGEVPVTMDFPQAADVPSYATGTHRWRWTAHFEAFVSAFALGPSVDGSGGRATPAGSYRFVVEGFRRAGRARVPYAIESEPFRVRQWRGIVAEDVRLEPDRRVSFRVGPRSSHEVAGIGAVEVGPIDYPDSYASSTRFIDSERTALRDPAAPTDPSAIEWFCFRCSFRPWLDFGDAESATVAFLRPNGRVDHIGATRTSDRWVSVRALRPNESARVGENCVRDAFGNVNGEASPAVGGEGPPEADAACDAPPAIEAAMMSPGRDVAPGGAPVPGAPAPNFPAGPQTGGATERGARLDARVSPRRVRAGRRVRLVFRVRLRDTDGSARPARGAVVRIGRRAVTDSRGRAVLAIVFRRAGVRRAVVTAGRARRDVVTVTVLRRR